MVKVNCAKAHIEKIRQEKGLGDWGGARGIVRDLERALFLLSDELYQKSTRFLFELIQNADDNEYSVDTPTLIFTYEDRRLRIDCNEVGFSAANVEAICAIGSSTKATKGEVSQYVGEKGIGFKSVFKVASQVWIASNDYSFKFDKSQPLGMIAPIWQTYPQPLRNGCTSTLLDLEEVYDHNELIRDLHAIDPRMLMFLRRLRRIEIVMRKNGAIVWQTKLSREQGYSLKAPTIKLSQDGRSLEYICIRQRVSGMPAERKREGKTHSEIVLAFPVGYEGTDELDSQQVYAFLPIRDYGFKFLIQGDFLLSASREDILHSSPWNIALRNACAEVFVNVARGLHQDFPQHLWHQYMPTYSLGDSFFEPARSQIMAMLASEKVLQCWNGDLSTPQTLIYVPKQYRDLARVPLLLSTTNARRYISDIYGHTALKRLEILGVREMTTEMFVQDFKEYVTQNKDEFAQKPDVWHNLVSKALCFLTFGENERDLLRGVPIIPTDTGSWVSADHQPPPFLPQESGQLEVPPGINILFVSPRAARSPFRRSLYTTLGISTISDYNVCRVIERTHMSNSFRPDSLSIAQLVSHLVFLFRAHWHNIDEVDLWLASSPHGRPVRATQMYIPSDNPHSASRYFGTDQDQFPFIHKSYLEIPSHLVQDFDGWISWLEHAAGVAVLPRLVQSSRPSSSETVRHYLSPSFLYIVENYKPMVFLQLLRDCWSHYSKYLVDDAEALEGTSKAREDLSQSLGALQVRCKDGQTAALGDTYIPILELESKAYGGFPFLDVSDPEDKRWSRLEHLGIGVKADLRFYLQCLQGLVASRGFKPPDIQARVHALLEQIQARAGKDSQSLKVAFAKSHLIRVPLQEGQRGRWVRTTSCLWAGGPCYRRLVPLKDHFPGLRSLFCGILEIRDATAKDLILEAKGLRTDDPPDHFRDIFLELNSHAEKEELTPPILEEIRKLPFIPIKRDPASPGLFEALECCNSSYHWFIADRDDVFKSFRGLIPLLGFRVEDVAKMSLALSALGVEERLLTKSAQTSAVTTGSDILNEEMTNRLRQRSEYFLRLIPKSHKYKTDLRSQIRNIHVFSAGSIVQHWSVEVNGEAIKGRPVPRHVVLMSRDARLKLYLEHGYMDKFKSPIELVEEIAGFCDIPRDQWHVLNLIIIEELPRIEAAFKRYGIPDLPTERCDEDELNGLNDGEASIGPHAQGADDVPTTASPSYRKSTLQDFRRFMSVYVVGGNRRIKSKSEPGQGIDAEDDFVEGFQEWHQSSKNDQTVRLVDLDDNPNDSESRGGSLPENMNMFVIEGNDTNGYLENPNTDKTAEVAGELLFHKTLTRLLKAQYQPEEHWTSKSREEAGFRSFQGSSDTHASFTLPDRSGKFTRIMAEGEPWIAHWVASPPVWHIEVMSTLGGLKSKFSMTNAQLQRARRLTVVDPRTKPTEVSLLVRAFDVRTPRPDLNFFRDPWECFLSGELQVESWHNCCIQETDELG